MVRNETVVLVEVPAREAARVLQILRDVEGEPPLTFTFHPSSVFDFEAEANLFRREAPSSQRLAEKAVRLAHSFSIEGGAKPRGHPLLLRLRESERILKWTDASLTMSAEVHHAFALSAEWLLDNAYLIQGQINEIRRSLPANYYEQLPVIASGPQAGLPRVYRIATEIVAESDGALDAETIRTFLVAFQSVSPLNIGELWAVPLMLRLRLVECLRSLAIQVEQLQRESEEADFWANRLITAARRSPERLVELMAELVRRHPEPTAHFASELVAHLYDEEAALPMVSVWLDRSLRAPMPEVVQQEHRRQAVQQTSLANVIASCRRLTQIQWQELFEAVSRADVEFAKDPAPAFIRAWISTRGTVTAMRSRRSPGGRRLPSWRSSATRWRWREPRRRRSRAMSATTSSMKAGRRLSDRPAPARRLGSARADGCDATPRDFISEASLCSPWRWWPDRSRVTTASGAALRC